MGSAGKVLPTGRSPSPGGTIGTRVALLRAVEFESVLANEVSRLRVVADVASRAIVARRPWWVVAVDFFRTVVL